MSYDDYVAQDLERQKQENLEYQKEIIKKQELMSIEIEKLEDIKSDSSMLIMEYKKKLFMKLTFLITIITILCSFIPNPAISSIVLALSALVGSILTIKDTNYQFFGYDTNYRYHKKRIACCEYSIQDYKTKIKDLDKSLNRKRQEVVNIYNAIRGIEPVENSKIIEIQKAQAVYNSQDTIDYLIEEKNKILSEDELIENSKYVKRKILKRK